MKFVFNERKTAQAAALLLREAGGSMPYIKLMKLLYLADRQSLIETGYPITGDRLLSMDRGPVLSRVLDFITWGRFDAGAPWPQYVTPRDGYDVRAAGQAETDELSEYEMDVLREVTAKFGHFDRWRLVDLTHELPEWVNPSGSAIEIDVGVILRDAGRSDEEIAEIASQTEAIRLFRSAYAK
ncbi:MAG: Panacea domain-containing protein [Dehalococcoidia bacterium]